jgi:antitoxin (DNA-binding transcriptional repressor) of toxin-antitoxin stability system
VGVRELKNRLSEYIRLVRSGEGLLVTDRGQVVAELAPPGQASADATVPPGLAALARRGLVTLGVHDDDTGYPPLPRTGRPKRTAAQLLEEERGKQ